jgi:gamma-butyrobetaine dioxygenase
MEALYSGYRRFILLTRDERFQYFHLLNAGDLIVFDNRRILHARNAFNLETGHRHLQGCYVDKDELLSRIRVLERGI